MKNRTIKVKGSEIKVSRKEQDDYISLTDIAACECFLWTD